MTYDQDYIELFEHYGSVCIDLGPGIMTDLSAEFLLSEEKPVVTFVTGGKSLAKSGARADMTNIVLHYEFESRLVEGIPAEPDLDDVARIIEALEQS